MGHIISLSTTSNKDRQLLRQKSSQKFLVMKTKKNWCLQKNSLFWHFNSHFVLKTSVHVFTIEIF